MTSKTFKYTSLAVDILQRIIGSRFVISGLENIPQKPVMFVANHFTRSETFFIPYLIYKHTNRQVRCLADSSLFHGFLGRFLESTGTISTKNENRDKIIVKDLIKGDYDWLIYPEGSMVKNKKIEKQDLFISHTPYRTGHVRTGSAVLALKSHLYRQDLIEAYKANDEAVLQDFKQNLNLEYTANLTNLETYIVPVSITYYPIRPGHNRLEIFAQKKIEKISPRLVEELQIEGNLLSKSEINLHFGKAIKMSEYVNLTRNMVYQIPIIKNETKTNFVIKYFKYRLTTDFMSQIYSNIEINLDHIFSATLRHFSEKEIKINHLKRIIYNSALMIAKTNKYRINHSIKEENLFKIFSDENHKEFNEIFSLAQNLDEIQKIDERIIRINKSALFKENDFHQIRLQNTLQVIFNEFSLLEIADDIVRRNCKLEHDELKKKVFESIKKLDLQEFEDDYKKYYDSNFSKDKSIGAPFFLDKKSKLSRKVKNIGILLCHGYKSCPKETEALAKYLNDLGYKVYAARLKGHGTSPINIQDVSWQDWYSSLERGYAILNNSCSKIILAGFSTGGLLSLLFASSNHKKISALISINSAIKLNDIRARFVPTINLWNEFLDKIHITKGKFEYVDDEPENPNLNYSRNYLKGVEELEKLMKKCEENLSSIKIPTLVIQAKHDPVINSISGKIIFDQISSQEKILFEPDLKNHVIINGEKKEEIFANINGFLLKYV